MYKITLYDLNCCPICDGTTYWFVEDLEEFEQKWVPLQSKININTVERYYRSKFGEIVTDYFSDEPSLNIVQKIDYNIITKKKVDYTNKIVDIQNTYGCTTKIEFDSLHLELMVINTEGKYRLVGKYKGKGCKRLSTSWNRWYNIEVKYSQMNFYGNQIAEYYSRDVDWDKQHDSDRYKDFYTNDPDFYKDEEIESFVWLPIKEVNESYKIGRITQKDLAILLRDIVGEAG